ncbi:hypothetical protein BU17DRAFT_79235 [Hysterangium stoloniferum]|nr:hypothetical protein BU17DRAFT_79235 [Hysterangium stoloniferum]
MSNHVHQPHQSLHPIQHHSPSSQSQSWPTNVISGPPPILQEVYILDCKSCDTFLTNRGMKAVLLLQPEVPLYSSDALPINCSANPGPPEYPPPLEAEVIHASTLSCPSGLPAPPARTCECLTQTLSCHGCGSSVGYMVVIPCHRCCSSVSPTNRHTNRHRFVFFNKEIKATTRHYIPYEPGVIPTSPPLVSAITPPTNVSPNLPSSTISYTPLYDDHDVGELEPSYTLPESSSLGNYHSLSSSTSSLNSNHLQNAHTSSFQFLFLKPERGKLRAGDIVYWHNLSRSGEIPAVVEDERARRTCNSVSPPGR